MKIYPIVNEKINEIPKECHLKDLTDEWYIKKYTWLYTFGKDHSKKMIIDVFNHLWVNTNTQFIQKLPSLSNSIRNIVKKEKKELIELLDSPDFLITYAYLLAWFSVNHDTINSHKDINSIYDFSKIIIELLSKSQISSNSFFCAHRENKYIHKNKLVDEINKDAFLKVENLVSWILWNTANITDSSINFFNMKWTQTWALWVFPNILNTYISDNKIILLLQQLDNHFEQIKSYAHKSSIHSIDWYHVKVKEFMETQYGQNWWELKVSDLNTENDIIAKIWIEHTLPNIQRIFNWANFYHILHSDSYNQLDAITQDIIHAFTSQNIIAKAIYETVFYYLRWYNTKLQWDIALGFDRDHDDYQIQAFKAWYNYNIENPLIDTNGVPLIYAKRTWNKSWNNIFDLSFRQFWHYDTPL